MLVLARLKGQAIVVGRDVRIVVVEARDGKARLGIEAPSDVPVHRQEVADEIERERLQREGAESRLEKRPGSIDPDYSMPLPTTAAELQYQTDSLKDRIVREVCKAHLAKHGNGVSVRHLLSSVSGGVGV